MTARLATLLVSESASSTYRCRTMNKVDCYRYCKLTSLALSSLLLFGDLLREGRRHKIRDLHTADKRSTPSSTEMITPSSKQRVVSKSRIREMAVQPSSSRQVAMKLLPMITSRELRAHRKFSLVRSGSCGVGVSNHITSEIYISTYTGTGTPIGSHMPAMPD